jgi:hypothetical protein
MNVAGHDSNFALLKIFISISTFQNKQKNHLFWRNDSRAIGANETALALAHKLVLNPDHVLLRNALGDAHNQGHFSVDGLFNGLGRTGRWNVDYGRIGLGRGTCLKMKLIFRIF